MAHVSAPRHSLLDDFRAYGLAGEYLKNLGVFNDDNAANDYVGDAGRRRDVLVEREQVRVVGHGNRVKHHDIGIGAFLRPSNEIEKHY